MRLTGRCFTGLPLAHGATPRSLLFFLRFLFLAQVFLLLHRAPESKSASGTGQLSGMHWMMDDRNHASIRPDSMQVLHDQQSWKGAKYAILRFLACMYFTLTESTPKVWTSLWRRRLCSAYYMPFFTANQGLSTVFSTHMIVCWDIRHRYHTCLPAMHAPHACSCESPRTVHI